MSYIHKPHSKPLEHRTPFQLLQLHVDAHPHKEAFVFRDQLETRKSLTFQEYELKSRFLSAALLEKGVKRGDRVLVMLPTSIEFVLLHMALNKIGVIAVPSEEGTLPKITDLACIITCFDSSSPNHDKAVRNIQAALAENSQLKMVVVVGSSFGALDHSKVYLYKKLIEMGKANPDCDNVVKRAEATVQMDDPTVVLFTSGTTSIPKPIQYTNHGFINASLAGATLMTIDKSTIFFSDSPFDWITGLFFSVGNVIALGSTSVIFPPKIAFQGEMVQTIMRTVVEENCSHAWFMSYILHDMTTCNEILEMDLSKLKIVVNSGQLPTFDLLKKTLKMMPHVSIINLYGTTETCGISSQVITKDSVETMESGEMDVVDGCELKLVDEDGHIVPLNTQGELCARSVWVSFCNWDIFIMDKEHVTGSGKNGWHFTKDAACIDHNGKLRLFGRMDDMIKCASEMISPNEIEALLLGQPNIKNVCVVGVPDQRLYMKLCACIILKDGDHSNEGGHLAIEKEIDDWCKEKCRKSTRGLACKPHYYVFVDSFPLSRTGKLSRRLVREMAIKILGL